MFGSAFGIATDAAVCTRKRAVDTLIASRRDLNIADVEGRPSSATLGRL